MRGWLGSSRVSLPMEQMDARAQRGLAAKLALHRRAARVAAPVVWRAAALDVPVRTGAVRPAAAKVVRLLAVWQAKALAVKRASTLAGSMLVAPMLVALVAGTRVAVA